MPFAVWDDAYKINISEIDAQHKKLFELINDLHSALKGGRARDVLEDILSRLTIYCNTHFATEERHMRNYSYPEYRVHKTQHDELTQKTNEFYERFKSAKSDITLDLMEFLKGWLQNHILKMDKQFGVYLNLKGLK
ncbi:MAG: bacteriohemerythrin [Thermodesulfovibrionales bacterium]|nr:bacteriohemerythrin [Thermodesulfovibrionales bacterium]